jgi:hypothetical protein
MNEELARFYGKLTDWSEKTFGPAALRSPFGPLKHAMKEVEEAILAPGDIEEYVDILHLLFDAAWRAGVPYHRIMWSGEHQFLMDMQALLGDLLYQPDEAVFQQAITTLFAAAFAAGFTREQFFKALWEKFEKNQKRQWPKPSPDEPCEHIKNEDQK